MGNFGILAIGAGLILAVLFIGYKMDTASDGAQARKAAKAVKAKKAKLKQRQAEYEYTDKEESDIYANENLHDMHYESDYDERYESEYVSQNDLAEDDEYEEDDITIFEQQPTDAYTFNDDIDDEINFETYDSEETVEEFQEYEEPKYEEYEEYEEEEAEPDGPEAIIDFGIFDEDEEESVVEPVIDFEVEIEPELEPEPEKPKRRGRPKKVKEEKEIASKGRKAKKVVEPELEDEIEEEPNISSTMVFDVEKLNAEIEGLNDEDDISESFVDGPFKQEEEDAKSFMDKINSMKQVASADDFTGFSVDTRDEGLKAVHKKYSKKKAEEELNLINDNQIAFTQDEQEENKETVDIGFLAEMEKTLKQNQKDRMTKDRKKKDE